MAGIACPACKAVDRYKSHQGGPGKGDDRWERRKKCECGAVFITLEVPIALVSGPPEPVEPVAPAPTTVEPVAPAPEPVTPAVPVNSIFAPQQ